MDDFVHLVGRLIVGNVDEAYLLKNWEAILYVPALDEFAAELQVLLRDNRSLFVGDALGLELFPDDRGQQNEDAEISDHVL